MNLRTLTERLMANSRVFYALAIAGATYSAFMIYAVFTLEIIK